MSIDPFAAFDQGQAPSQPAQATPVAQPAPQADPVGSDLAAAPEVAAHPAPTAAQGGSARQRRSEADKARAALETATRKVESLQKRCLKAKGDFERYNLELDAAQKRADYLAQHPALQGDADTASDA